MSNAQEAQAIDLIGEIERVFKGVWREDGISLHEAIVRDNHGYWSERFEARLLDTDRRWQDVSAEDIESLGNVALSFLDAKSLRYYLPAFMVWSLRNYETTRSDSFTYLLFTLARKRGPNDRDFALLNSEQKTTVCRFLRYFASVKEEMWMSAPEALDALSKGWSEYCPESLGGEFCD